MFESEGYSFDLRSEGGIVSYLMNVNTMFIQVRNALQTEVVISARAKLEKLCIY